MNIQEIKAEKSHEYKTLEFYAHDYRDMAMSEEAMKSLLTEVMKKSI